MIPPRSRRGTARAAVARVRSGLRRLAGTVRRVTIEGSSMEPALAPGDRLLVVPALWLRSGHIVAVPDPRNPDRILVKRVTSIDRRNKLVSVEGDNPGRSTDSRTFGPVPRAAIVGRAAYRYAPSARAGPVGSGR